MNGVTGISIIYHSKAIMYLGKYVAGIFSDNNYMYRNTENKGWGFKFDLYFAPLIRPIPKFWRKEFYKEEPKIKDVIDTPLQNKYFNEELIKRLKEKQTYMIGVDENIPENSEVYDFKFGVLNPWKGQYLFVFRVPKIIPFIFFSLSTPWINCYLGFKTSKIEPFLNKKCFTVDVEGKNRPVDQGDYTWSEKKERNLAEKINDNMFRSAVPSGSFRMKRN